MADNVQTTDEQETTHETEPEESVAELKVQMAKMQSALKDRNKEEAARRKKLEALEKAEEERQQAAMTEADHLKAAREAADKRADEAEQRAKQTLIRAAFVAEAAKQGAAHPDDVYLLADASGVEVDESGKVTGAAEAVKALVDAGRVPLSGKAPAPSLDSGAGVRERSGQTVNLTPLEMDLSKKLGLTPDRYQEQKAAIRRREDTDAYQESLDSIAALAKKQQGDKKDG